jgi:plasmid stability protein
MLSLHSLQEGLAMATMTIRNLDDEVKARLRVRAAQHGHSMEEEARSILRAALATDEKGASGAALLKAIRARIEPYGGFELHLPPREPMREPPDFSSSTSDEPERR